MGVAQGHRRPDVPRRTAPPRSGPRLPSAGQLRLSHLYLHSFNPMIIPKYYELQFRNIAEWRLGFQSRAARVFKGRLVAPVPCPLPATVAGAREIQTGIAVAARSFPRLQTLVRSDGSRSRAPLSGQGRMHAVRMQAFRCSSRSARHMQRYIQLFKDESSGFLLRLPRFQKFLSRDQMQPLPRSRCVTIESFVSFQQLAQIRPEWR